MHQTRSAPDSKIVWDAGAEIASVASRWSHEVLWRASQHIPPIVDFWQSRCRTREWDAPSTAHGVPPPRTRPSPRRGAHRGTAVAQLRAFPVEAPYCSRERLAPTPPSTARTEPAPSKP